MDVYFRDENLQLLAIVDDYIQMMWEEKLRGEGTLTIELPNTASYRALVKSAVLVTIKESRRCMIIESVKYQINGEYTHIVINGYPVEQFFKNRWCQPKSMYFWWKVAAAVDIIRGMGFEAAKAYLFRDTWDTEFAQSYVRNGFRFDRNAYSLIEHGRHGYGITEGWFADNQASLDTFRRETTSYLNDYAAFILKVFLTGLFDSRLAIPKLSINTRIILPDGRDYNRDYASIRGLTNRTAFDAYGYLDKPKDWTFGKSLVDKNTSASSTVDHSGMSAWDVIVNGSQDDHFEVRFDYDRETLTLNHIATASLDMYEQGFLSKIELSPLLENIDSAEYTEYRFKEPTSVYEVVNFDDPYDGHITLTGDSGSDPNSGYARVEYGTKLDPPERVPSQYYGHAIIYGKSWTAPDGTTHLDRDLVIRRDNKNGAIPFKQAHDAYCTFSTTDGGGGGGRVEAQLCHGGIGRMFMEEYPHLIAASAKKAFRGSNRSGTVSAVPDLGYVYNRDYYLGDCANVTFATGEEPVIKLVKVAGYNWNVTNGSVVHHPIFEAL